MDGPVRVALDLRSRSRADVNVDYSLVLGSHGATTAEEGPRGRRPVADAPHRNSRARTRAAERIVSGPFLSTRAWGSSSTPSPTAIVPARELLGEQAVRRSKACRRFPWDRRSGRSHRRSQAQAHRHGRDGLMGTQQDRFPPRSELRHAATRSKSPGPACGVTRTARPRS